MYAKKISLAALGVFLLASCIGNPKTTPIPTVVLPAASSVSPAATPVTSSSGAVSASGEVTPVHKVDVGFGVAGIVQTVNVKEGDLVKAGQVIAVLDNIPQLQAQLLSNQQALASAQSDFDNLVSNAALNLANAQLAMTTAQKQYNDAVQHRKVRGVPRCDKEKIDLYFQVLGDAKKKLDELTAEPHETTTSYLQRIDIAQGEYNVAQANYQYCVSYTDQEIAESDAAFAVADAALQQATARHALLEKANGVDPADVARKQAAVAAAKASIETIQYNLTHATLAAPIDGMIVALNVEPGQATLPGQALLTIASMDDLQVETTDLSERDIARVSVGQPASVLVEAMGKTITGKVAYIDPRSTKVGGDVVFKVVIQLDEQPAGLLWGMSARVDITAR